MSERISLSPGLREAANLLEQHPQLPQPYITTLSNGRVELNWYLHGHGSLDEQKRAAAEIVRTLRGDWNKTADNVLGFAFTRNLDRVRLFISVDRPAVCERVVVGTEKVTIPAVEAQPERTITQDKVEWRCQPLLAGNEAAAAEAAVA